MTPRQNTSHLFPFPFGAPRPVPPLRASPLPALPAHWPLHCAGAPQTGPRVSMQVHTQRQHQTAKMQQAREKEGKQESNRKGTSFHSKNCHS